LITNLHDDVVKYYLDRSEKCKNNNKIRN